MSKKEEQNIFHMYPQSLMKDFFNDNLNEKGFISYDFEDKLFKKNQLNIKTINSITFQKIKYQ